MIRLQTAVLLAFAAILTSETARASGHDWHEAPPPERHWSLTVTAGPASQKYIGAVMQDFNLQSTEYMVSVTLDRKLVRLWRDFYLSGEVQLGHYFNGHANTVFSLMLGFEATRLFGFERTSFAFHTGPSYALDPPYWSIGYKHRIYAASRRKFLNALDIVFASGLPFTEDWAKDWDWVAALYHRSGVFGVYSEGDDDGLTAGLGLRYHF
jgi:hypothetical protein